MIDTMGLRSPSLSEETAQSIERYLKTRTGVDNASGEVEYQFVSGTLPGSFSENVSVNVRRQDFKTFIHKGKAVTSLYDVEPFLRIEGSVHKALLGHNVFGGPLEPEAAARWFIADIERRMRVQLPPAESWFFERLDWAEAYNLGSYEACEEFINGMAWARYPRRKVNRYCSESVFFPGTTSAYKVYHKGPEFQKHDYKRLNVTWNRARVTLLQETANNYLRSEVSIKSKKLQADFGQKPSIVKVTREYLENVHDRETARVAKEGKSDMETVRNAEEVRARLLDVYGDRLGKVLFGTWSEFVMVGEKTVRHAMPRATFYLHRQQLAAAGVSWVGTDVVVQKSSRIPAGFSLCRSDPRRLTTEAPEVTLALAAYTA